MLSVGAHALICALIVLFALDSGTPGGSEEADGDGRRDSVHTDCEPEGHDGGGGGGGNHELLEASKGKLPKFAKEQIAPPQILRLDNPKLAVEPTVVMPPIKLPDAALPIWACRSRRRWRLRRRARGQGRDLAPVPAAGLDRAMATGLARARAAGMAAESTTSAAEFRTPSLYMRPIRSFPTRRGARSTRGFASSA